MGGRPKLVAGAVAAAALLAQLPATASPQPDPALWLIGADGTDAREVAPDIEHGWDFAWSPDGSSLAYGNGDIWVLELATGARTNVTDTFGTGWEVQPTWSPDGRRIAYVNGSDIWIRDADGTDQMQLTEGSTFDRLPAWAPAGDLISFLRSDGSAPRETLHVADAAGGSSRPLVGVEGPTSWSPDGGEIAYRFPEGGIRVVDVGTGAVDVVAADGSSPAWDPAGNRIAYRTGDGVYVVPREGGAPVQVLAGAADTFDRITWSPDGEHLALAFGFEISVIDVATGESGPLTETDGTEDDSSPLWSPAGDLVAYVGTTYCCHFDTRWDRSIEAEAARHLVVRGKVEAVFPACVKRVPLSVSRRRDGEWTTLGNVGTGRRGGFRLPLPDRPGRYRVVAPRLELEIEGDLHTCLKASVLVRHRHRRPR